jgi:beta-fructofuranosidase
MRRILRISSSLLLLASLGCSAEPSSPSAEPSDIDLRSTSQELFTISNSQWVKTSTPFKKIYDPSVGESQPWYFNDHTFIKDASGLWHIFGITNPEPTIPLNYQVETEDQFGHATSTTLDDISQWHKVTNFALTASGTETHLWAPHIVKGPNNLYYMFYAGGGANNQTQQINYATSTNLTAWNKMGTIFTDGYQARDPMLLWDQGLNKWIMYYTATKVPQTSSPYIVAYRTANQDFTNWSGRGIAFEDPKTGTDAGPTESPFVIKRGNLYYLFIGPRPYHFPYVPPDYPDTDVFVSSVPTSFSPTNLVGHIAAHAAEVVDDGSKLWVSDTGWAKGGVYLAELKFFNTPASGSKLYAISSNNDSVWQYDGATWKQIGNSSSKLVTSGFGVFSVLPLTGSLYRYNFDANNTWTKVSDAATNFVANETGLFRQDSGVSKWDPLTSTWTPVGGPASVIYAGGDDLYATNNITGDIYHYNGTPMNWTKIGNPGSQFVANVNGVYGLNSLGIFQWTGSKTEWVQVGGPANTMYAGGNSMCATVPLIGDLNCYKNSPDSWAKAADPATSYAVCDGAIYALRSNGVFNGSTQIRGPMAAVSCGK